MNAYMRGKASARIFVDLRAARAKQEEIMEFAKATGAFAERRDEWRDASADAWACWQRLFSLWRRTAKRGQPRPLRLISVYRLKKKHGAARTPEHGTGAPRSLSSLADE